MYGHRFSCLARSVARRSLRPRWAPVLTPLSTSPFSTSADVPDSSSDGADSSQKTFEKIACIGTGKMAQAIIEPLVRTGLQPAELISCYDVSTATMTEAQEKYGVQVSDSISQVVDGADMILCAVKPQNLTPSFFSEIKKGPQSVLDNAIFLSVIAGKTIAVFEREGGFAKVVRSMPNTPAQVGEGMTVWSCTDALTAADRKKIQKVLSSCGKSMYVDDEAFIDMATSISGSGPAYIFLLMESMIDGAVHMGFPRDKATTLVYHTMLGSTLYAMETGEHPAVLRNLVTSPSGTTASALYELENGRIRTVIKDAMWACFRRSLEMGDHDSNVGPGRTPVPETRFFLTPSDYEKDIKDGPADITEQVNRATFTISKGNGK